MVLRPCQQSVLEHAHNVLEYEIPRIVVLDKGQHGHRQRRAKVVRILG